MVFVVCLLKLTYRAKNIVMSLWSVDDEATKDLMGSFYKQTVTHKEYDKALKKAKLQMIREDSHPFIGLRLC